jgi:hypothetical protein
MAGEEVTVGLDTVELVMDIEDAFGIAIDDHDASRIETVGQLYDHVLLLLRRHPGRRVESCASAHCFYRLRRELLADRAVPPSRVRPDSTFGELVPAGLREEVYKRLSRKLGLPSPPSRFVARTGTRELQPDLRLRDVVASYVLQVPDRFITAGRVDAEAVWRTLSEVILEYSPGDPTRITRGARIVKDLHLD